jgi:hypothetical protein
LQSQSYYEGKIDKKGFRKLDIGGAVDDSLERLLVDRGYLFSSLSDRIELKKMKEKLCYLAKPF